jgi:hypothetical protein
MENAREALGGWMSGVSREPSGAIEGR